MEKCEEEPVFFQFSLHSAVRKILKKCDLEELINYPLCLKQTEIHWKIMATRFRCSGKAVIKAKRFEKIFSNSQCKNHFINLSQKENNILVSYLLKYSKEIINNTDVDI